jgi:hypothetical protein
VKPKKKKVRIIIKPSRKRRTPHKPTQVHRDKTKYTRKGKIKNKRDKELQTEIVEDD